MRRLSLPVILSLLVLQSHAQSKEEQHLLNQVQQFFKALEEQDTTAFRDMFVDPAYMYSVREVAGDSVVLRTRLTRSTTFRPEQIIKERLRESTTSVKIDGRIAMVWAPYDLWVNDEFSHCGVDVFTFVKVNSGWKIASIAYTIETTKCQ